MIETGVTTDSLLAYDPSLAKYYPTGYGDFDNQISEALRIIISKLMQNKKDIKKYCTPLELSPSVTINANTETTTVSDDIRRMLWKVNVTTFAGVLSFTLKGCDTESGTYETVGVLTFTATGSKYLIFTTPYKYYKIVPSVTTSITYKSDLIESSFYHSHLYMSLMLAYKISVKAEGDRFDYKTKDMQEMFNNDWNTMLATYDEDDSKTIDNDLEKYGEPTNNRFLR